MSAIREKVPSKGQTSKWVEEIKEKLKLGQHAFDVYLWQFERDWCRYQDKEVFQYVEGTIEWYWELCWTYKRRFYILKHASKPYSNALNKYILGLEDNKGLLEMATLRKAFAKMALYLSPGLINKAFKDCPDPSMRLRLLDDVRVHGDGYSFDILAAAYRDLLGNGGEINEQCISVWKEGGKCIQHPQCREVFENFVHQCKGTHEISKAEFSAQQKLLAERPTIEKLLMKHRGNEERLFEERVPEPEAM